MSDQNDYFRQGMRDLATAAQLSAANEAAKNSRKLLESQKEQIALEQQKLQIEQIRLMEERAHREAAQTKAERQKAIRTAMAAMERLLQSFGRDLAAGRFNQLIAGISLGAFLGVLVQKRLHNLSDVESELEDLADIRFMGTLQQSFLDLAAANTKELGSGPMKEALQKLCELAMWAGRPGSELLEIEKRVSSFLEALRAGAGETNALDKIRSGLQRIEDERKKSVESEGALVRLWAGSSGALKSLCDGGMGPEEIQFTIEEEVHPSLEVFKERLAATRRDLGQCEKILKAAEAAWHSDKALFEKGVGEVNAGQFSEAERTEKKMSSRYWTDFDAARVNRALEGERNRLLAEVDALLPSKKKEAAALAEKHSQAYAGSVLIGEALSHRHSVLVKELMAEKKLRASEVLVFVVLAAFVAVFVVLRQQNETAEGLRVSRVSKATAERRERARAVEAEGKILLDEEDRELRIIPSGTFIMGSTEKFHAPVHSVYVSAFFIGETEVTYGEWKSVLAWAKANGYFLLHNGEGESDKHPVTDVTWYDAVKWCNAKSEKEGLKPCYKQNGLVYRREEDDSIDCDWNANGYRLPTEAEWEKAARGDLVGKRYPNGDTLNEDDANFDSSGTRKVKSFAANGFGLFEMAGNVSEWCWSDNPYKPQLGGSWVEKKESCRVSKNDVGNPRSGREYVGLRLVRRSGL